MSDDNTFFGIYDNEPDVWLDNIFDSHRGHDPADMLVRVLVRVIREELAKTAKARAAANQAATILDCSTLFTHAMLQERVNAAVALLDEVGGPRETLT